MYERQTIHPNSAVGELAQKKILEYNFPRRESAHLPSEGVTIRVWEPGSYVNNGAGGNAVVSLDDKTFLYHVKESEYELISINIGTPRKNELGFDLTQLGKAQVRAVMAQQASNYNDVPSLFSPETNQTSASSHSSEERDIAEYFSGAQPHVRARTGPSPASQREISPDPDLADISKQNKFPEYYEAPYAKILKEATPPGRSYDLPSKGLGR